MTITVKVENIVNAGDQPGPFGYSSSISFSNERNRIIWTFAGPVPQGYAVGNDYWITIQDNANEAKQ